MLSKKIILLILISLSFFVFAPSVNNSRAQYACNQSCVLNPSGCAAGLSCIGGVCRNPTCSLITDCSCPSYSCDQDCSLYPAGCSAGTTCTDVGGAWRCRKPSCSTDPACACPYDCNERCDYQPSQCSGTLACYTGVNPNRCRNPNNLNDPACADPLRWTKLKDTSFYSVNDLNNAIPATVVAYDGDDSTSRYFVISSATSDPGNVVAKSINLNMTDPSAKKWKASLTKTISMTPANFLGYVKARKEYATISNLAEITSNDYDSRILVINSNLIVDDSNKTNFNNRNLVMIVSGNLNINSSVFAPTNASIAFLVTGTITFANSTTEARGIFVAPNINLGTTANQGIKIVGNLSALTTLTNNRTWASISQPSVFIVFNKSYYTKLLPLLSIANYNWQQLK